MPNDVLTDMTSYRPIVADAMEELAA